MSSYVIRPVEITKPLFSRASTATYIGADGLLKTAAVDVRRPLYVGGVNTGWIYEPAAATNLLTYSEQFENAAWTTKVAATVTANAAVSPDGATTADRLVETATTTIHYVVRSYTFAAGTHTFSVFAKPVGSRNLFLQCTDLLFAWNASINLITGAVVTSSGAPVVTVTPAANGFFRCSLTFTVAAGAGAGNIFLISGALDGGQGTVGDGSSGLYLFGAQMQVGALTSYIPTTAAAATRAAEVLSGSSGRELVTTNAVETYLPWNPATGYTAATPTVSGSKVTRATTNRIYENIIGGVNAVLPENDPLRWSDAGPTNAMAMFDKEVGTVTTATDSIVVVLRPGEVNSMAVQELSNCNSVHVVMKDAPGGTVVFDQTLDLENADILDIYDWFFAPYEVRTDAILLDLPEFPDCEMTITLGGAGAVGCGLLVLGKAQELGSAEMGASIGIISFAEKIRTPRGTLTVRPGEIARRMNLTVWADGVARNRIFRLMGEVDGLPCIWIGDNGPGFEALIVYGFYRDFDMVLSYLDIDLLNLQIEGLI